MEQSESERATGEASSARAPQAHPGRARRGELWRAVAGMAAALAMGAAIVALENSRELATRAALYRSRIDNLSRKVKDLGHEAIINQQRLAAMRKELASRDRLNAILIAPDRKTIALASPERAGTASGSVAMSDRQGGAVLVARGLPKLVGGQVFDAWWKLTDGPAAKAAEFRSADDGTATVFLDPPPHGSPVASCTVTLEPSQGGIEPTGPLKLSGRYGR